MTSLFDDYFTLFEITKKLKETNSRFSFTTRSTTLYEETILSVMADIGTALRFAKAQFATLLWDYTRKCRLHFRDKVNSAEKQQPDRLQECLPLRFRKAQAYERTRDGAVSTFQHREFYKISVQG
jgi:hypothetical protein